MIRFKSSTGYIWTLPFTRCNIMTPMTHDRHPWHRPGEKSGVPRLAVACPAACWSQPWHWRPLEAAGHSLTCLLHRTAAVVPGRSTDKLCWLSVKPTPKQSSRFSFTFVLLTSPGLCQERWFRDGQLWSFTSTTNMWQLMDTVVQLQQNWMRSKLCKKSTLFQPSPPSLPPDNFLIGNNC